jgi:hypothetical protein
MRKVLNIIKKVWDWIRDQALGLVGMVGMWIVMEGEAKTLIGQLIIVGVILQLTAKRDKD